MEDIKLLSLIQKTMAGESELDEADSEGKECQVSQEQMIDRDEEKHIAKERTREELESLLTDCQKELETTKKQLMKTERQLEKSNMYNDTLRTMVETLSSQLHQSKNVKMLDLAIQVNEQDLNNCTGGAMDIAWLGVSASDLTSSSAAPTKDVTENQDHVTPGMDAACKLSIADAVRTTAEAVVIQQTHESLTLAGYVYDPDYRLYYHPDTGYYYDQTKGLFYDPHTGAYYYYDYDSGEYVFHSQVDMATTGDISQPQEESKVISKEKNIKSALTTGSHEKKKKSHHSKQVFANRKERRKYMQAKKERKREKEIKKERKMEKNRLKAKKHSHSLKKIRKREEAFCDASCHNRHDSVHFEDAKYRKAKSCIACLHRRSRSALSEGCKADTKNCPRACSSLSSFEKSSSKSRQVSRRSRHSSDKMTKNINHLRSNKKEQGTVTKDKYAVRLLRLCSDISNEDSDENSNSKINKRDIPLSSPEKSSTRMEFRTKLAQRSHGKIDQLDKNVFKISSLDGNKSKPTSRMGNNSNLRVKSGTCITTAEVVEEDQNDFVKRLKNRREKQETMSGYIVRENKQNVEGRVLDHDVQNKGAFMCDDVNAGDDGDMEDWRKTHNKLIKNRYTCDLKPYAHDHEKEKMQDSGTESGEISDSASGYSSRYSSRLLSCSSTSSLSETSSSSIITSTDSDDSVSAEEDNGNEMETDLTSSWPPCIRMVVQQSASVTVGWLYVVTCSGATIGSDETSNLTICIPDTGIGQLHAEIVYSEESGQYVIRDMGSRTGTYLGNVRISKGTNGCCEIHHGDVIRLGDTHLLCHIHHGTDTCDQCEPGVVMAKNKASLPTKEITILSKEEKQRQAKMQMKQLKKKYGLQNDAYKGHPSLKNPGYNDRADERRKTVGIDHSSTKQETPASVHRPLSSENMGHKLLQKMGWKAGESLGKYNSGIQEPIMVGRRANEKSGLGSGATFSIDDSNEVDLRKATRRIQAQQRYERISGDTSESTTRHSQPPTVPTTVRVAAKSETTKPKLNYKNWTQGGVEFSDT